jgi:hypothetical protein
VARLVGGSRRSHLIIGRIPEQTAVALARTLENASNSRSGWAPVSMILCCAFPGGLAVSASCADHSLICSSPDQCPALRYCPHEHLLAVESLTTQ